MISRLPAQWRTQLVDDIKAKSDAAIAIGPFGSRMKSECYVEEGVPVIRGTNLMGGREFQGEFVYISAEKAQELISSNVYDGDLVFPHRGAIGEVGIVMGGPRVRYVLSTSLMKLTCDRNIVDPLFVYYFFRSSFGRYELLKNASQVGTPGIATPLASLKSVRLPVPPLWEQRRIAAILSALDDKIELNRRMNRTLEEMAQAIFKSWFVDFDGQTEFEDSGTELGEVPWGWTVGPPSRLIDFNPRVPLAKGEVAKYLSMSEVPTEGFAVGGVEEKPYSGGAKFARWDTLLARITPCLENGKTALVDFLQPGEVGCGSTEFIVMRGKSGTPAEFVYCLARSPDFRAFAVSHMTGSSGRQRVSADSFAHYAMAIPNREILKLFGKVAQPLFTKITANNQQSRTLAELRDTLLPKLISGEIRVPEAEEAAEEAL